MKLSMKICSPFCILCGAILAGFKQWDIAAYFMALAAVCQALVITMNQEGE